METILHGLHDFENKVMFTQFNLVFALPWCFCVQNLVKIPGIFPQILRSNHLAYVAILNDVRDLENKVKVTSFELRFVLPWSLCVQI